MKKSKKCNNITNLPNISSLQHLLTVHLPDNPLFLDIETTGFSPSKSRLYLIGTAYAANQRGSGGPQAQLVTQQFFAETPEEESILLSELNTLLQRFDTIITFNGSKFDLPFLEGCCKRLGCKLVYNNKNYVDLYQLSCAYQNIFRLRNYQQKTVETFLGSSRKDTFSGGDLIQVYKKYVKQPDESLLHLLLLHNYEDLIGMACLIGLYAYEDFFKGHFTPLHCTISQYRAFDGENGTEAVIACELNEALPAQISCSNGCYYLHAQSRNATLSIPLYEGILKYFYPNFKDYYYLTQEDMALHKDVALYVDKAHRVKAKASNCYSKKTGIFLPQYNEVVTPALYEEYKAPISYFEYSGGIFENRDLFKDYCMHVLQVLKDGK